MKTLLTPSVSFGAPSLAFLDPALAVERPAEKLCFDRVTVAPEALHLSAVSGLRANGSMLEENQVLDLIRERRALLWRVEPNGRVHWLFFDSTAGRPLVAIVAGGDPIVIGIQPPWKSNRLTDTVFLTLKRLVKKLDPPSFNLDEPLLEMKQITVLLGTIPSEPPGDREGVTIWRKWSVARGKLPEFATFRSIIDAAAEKTSADLGPVFQVVVVTKKSWRPLLSHVSSVDLIQH